MSLIKKIKDKKVNFEFNKEYIKVVTSKISSRMLGIHRPTISANGCIIAQRFLRLYRARVAAPAGSLKIIRVVEQGQISFVRFDVMNNGRAWVRAAIG